jgi:hypothetical protein
MTIVAGSLQAVGKESVEVFGRDWSLSGLSGVLLYLLGFAGEVFVLTSVYLVMPAGRLHWRHALIGGVTAAVLWEITRHILVWYFATLSQVNVLYGSLTTAIVVLLSLEIAATLLLLGAQVISSTSGSASPARREAEGIPHRLGHLRRRASRPGDAAAAAPPGVTSAGATGSPAGQHDPVEEAAAERLGHRPAVGAREERAPEVVQGERESPAPGSTRAASSRRP